MSETATKFGKLKKKYALNNSYFKNRTYEMPATPYNVMEYFEEHGELPFDMGKNTENWLYECYVEYQKRAGTYHSQFFTPPATAVRIAELADKYFDNPVPNVLDACCGFGMLTKPLLKKGFIVQGFDFSQEMCDMYSYNTGCIVEQRNINHFELKENDKGWLSIVSNPPYEVKEATQFLSLLYELLDDSGVAILLLPKGFIDKERPKDLVKILAQFHVIHREDMNEDFARTKTRAEIVVLQK